VQSLQSVLHDLGKENVSMLKLIRIGEDREVDGIHARMKLLYARDFCPACALLPEEHDDEACDMRYTKEN
jgi:hypothetical protein